MIPQPVRLTIELALLALVSVTIALAGLLPRDSHSDRWTEWQEGSQRTMLGRHGLATGPLDVGAGPITGLEIHVRLVPLDLQADHFQILVQIDSESSTDPLIIGQWRDQLIVMQGRDFANVERRPRLAVPLGHSANRSPEGNTPGTVDLHVSLMSERNTARLGGGPVATHRPSPYAFAQPATRITVGNSPDGALGWTGLLEGVTIASSAPGNEVAMSRDYRFDIDALPLVLDDSGAAAPLHVPPPGHFPDYAYIGSMALPDLLAQNRLDLLINLLGFMPLGFVLQALVGRLPTGTAPAMAFTTLAGLAVSLGIESLQTLIPGRSPHVHDLVLNTLGAAAGAAALLIVERIRGHRGRQPRQHP